MGFNVFSIRSAIFAKLIVLKEDRNTPAYQPVIASDKFLSGFKLALSVLNVLLLFNLANFSSDPQRLILLILFAVAHGSQFCGNLPLALQNRKGIGACHVKGTIRFILITDFLLILANFGLAVSLL